MEKMKKNMRRNVVVNNVMPAHTTSGKTINLNFDPVEIRKENVNTEMKDCAVRMQPVKLKLKGDNVRLPEEIRIGHAELSVEIGGMEMSEKATDHVMNLWQIVGNGLIGLFQSNGETEKKEDQKHEEKPEEAEEKEERYDFDPVGE